MKKALSTAANEMMPAVGLKNSAAPTRRAEAGMISPNRQRSLGLWLVFGISVGGWSLPRLLFRYGAGSETRTQ
jgi:hypothetical protein